VIDECLNKRPPPECVLVCVVGALCKAHGMLIASDACLCVRVCLWAVQEAVHGSRQLGVQGVLVGQGLGQVMVGLCR
jgi:hypothetical protein